MTLKTRWRLCGPHGAGARGCLGMVAVAGLLLLGAGRAQDNPFEAVARVAYSGGYEGKDAEGAGYVLVLCERGERFDGWVAREGNRMQVEAVLEAGVLAGEMRDRSDVSAIKVTFDGEKASFLVGAIRVDLARRAGPPFKGSFAAGEVKLVLETGAGDVLTGNLKFQGKMYEVQARANGALCWGTFGGGDKTWPFALMRESPTEARFVTGSFGQVLSDEAEVERLRLAEEKRIAEEKRQAVEEKRIAEEKRAAEEKRLAEEQRLAVEKRIAEEKRLADERPVIGIRLELLGDKNFMRAFIIGAETRVRVLEVIAGDPADKAGIRAGDVITHIGEHGVWNPDITIFCIQHYYKAGDKIPVRFVRDNEVQTVEVVARRRGKDE